MIFFDIFLIRLVCCSCIHSKSIDELEQSSYDRFDPDILFGDDLNVVERAAPRFGRAAPRFGRAAPRFGRRTAALILSRLNHQDRSLFNDETESKPETPFDTDSSINEKRASPRFGRSF